VYEFTLTATDDDGLTATKDIFIGVPNGINGKPNFLDGASAVATVVEGETEVGEFKAVEADGQGLTYDIAAGDDAADFNIDSNGKLSFNSAPDYIDGTTEGENTYRVTVTATDGTDTTNLVVDVTVAYEVTSTPSMLDNFDQDEDGEILNFSNLLNIDGGPTDAKTAFLEGWINFKGDNGDIIVQYDNDGGGDDYVDILTIDNGGNNGLTEADTNAFIF
jgi:hypothetical protein